MDTVLGGGYSLDDLRGATEAYVAKRTKTWLGACWYKPNTVLYLDWDDETIYQVGEVLSCSKDEAEQVLRLLKAAGMHFVFTLHTHEESEADGDYDDDDDDDDDEEEFDDDGWLPGSENKKEKKFSAWRPEDVVGKNYRYLGILSARGLRRQKQIILQDGCLGKVFFPGEEIPVLAEYAANMSAQYEKKTIHQIRLMLRLQIYYLVVLCGNGQ